jgi:hypothetical protein
LKLLPQIARQATCMESTASANSPLRERIVDQSRTRKSNFVDRHFEHVAGHRPLHTGRTRQPIGGQSFPRKTLRRYSLDLIFLCAFAYLPAPNRRFTDFVDCHVSCVGRYPSSSRQVRHGSVVEQSGMSLHHLFSALRNVYCVSAGRNAGRRELPMRATSIAIVSTVCPSARD